jgi:PAS domain S-box-containing protein
MQQDPPEKDLSPFHHQAEPQVAGDPAIPPETKAEAETNRLLHELLVHQVELEMQNEQLRDTRAELEAHAEHFTELYDFAPVGYFSVASDGTIRQLNLMGAEMLGHERALLLDHQFEEFLATENRSGFEKFLTGLFAERAEKPCEVKLLRRDQDPVIVRLTGSLSPDHRICRVAAMDLTEQRRSEAASREKIEDLDKIFNLSSDLLGIATLDGRFIRINPAFGRLLGHSDEELTSRCFLEFIHPEDLEASQNALATLKFGRDVLDFVNRYRCRDGSYRWIEWRATPYRRDLVCAFGRDITARKQWEDALRLSEEKFRRIVESSPTAMYLYQLEADGRLVLVGSNPAADRETGTTNRILYGKTVEEAFPNLANTQIPETYKRVACGELGTQSFEMAYTDEHMTGYFEVRAFRTGPGAIVVAFGDISERVQIREALKRSQDELESQVKQRTAQLQERTRQLRALANELTLAEERERRRIARLIHDQLQQMLVAALLNSGMLKQKLSENMPTHELDHIERILKESIQATRSLTSELSPAVLHQCGLAAALKWLRPWCKEKYGLDVAVEAEEGIDPDLDISVTLFLCVRELLFNTVKYSGVKSAALRMWRAPEDGMIRIEVSDQGAGFDVGVVRAREGTTGGFGLFNIRERLELLGGGLETKSTPGAGSRFTLWVPPLGSTSSATGDKPPPATPSRPRPRRQAANPANPAVSLLNRSAPRDGKIRIVVADDHTDVREGLVRIFQAERDFEVVGQAADGDEAVQLASHLLPDFVIMDLNMPRMNGLEATAAIHQVVPFVRVIGLSSHADDEHRSAMIRAGALDLLHKNDPPSLLLSTLRNCADLANRPDRGGHG